MLKKLLFILTFILYIFISGCGNPPQPYSKNINNNNYKNLSYIEKQKLLNFIINRYTLRNPNFYTKNDGCIYFNDAWYHFQYINKFKNCFIIKGNKIVREDESKCSNNYGKKFSNYCDYIGGRSDEYSEFINTIQEKLYSDFLDQLKSYSIFKKSCIKYKEERNKKLQQIQVSVVDNTGLLPQNIIWSIQTDVYAPEVNCLKEYLDTLSLKKNKKRFLICAKIEPYGFNKKMIGRYEIYLNKGEYCESFEKFPDDYKFFVDSVYFNFLPDKFVAKNRDLEVSIDNNQHILNIYNNSDQFIKVNSIVLYYGDIVSSNIFQFLTDSTHLDLRIPPKSYISKVIDFPESSQAFVELTNKNQTHKYGISLSYKKVNENILKTLFKTKEFSVNDF